MDKKLLNILACPSCKAKLILDETTQELICRFEQLAYPIKNDVPILIKAKARKFKTDMGSDHN